MVWTLTYRGKTEKAYGSLLPVEIIDAEVIAANFTGSPSLDKRNKPPTVTLEGSDKREIRVGEPLALSVVVKDDGIPQPRPSPQSRPPGRRSSVGLRVSWIQYRGPAAVTFNPVQALTYSDPRSELSPWTPGWQPPSIPPDGQILTNASFSTPGSYVIRVIAHDGYDYTAKDVTVTVLPPLSAKNN